jgi:hypothetical protein
MYLMKGQVFCLLTVVTLTCSLRKQYGKNLENALPLIVAGNITCLETPSADGVEPRRVYKVRAEKLQDVYTVLPQLYCTCESFQNIIRRGEDVCVRFSLDLSPTA